MPMYEGYEFRLYEPTVMPDPSKTVAVCCRCGYLIPLGHPYWVHEGWLAICARDCAYELWAPQPVAWVDTQPRQLGFDMEAAAVPQGQLSLWG